MYVGLVSRALLCSLAAMYCTRVVLPIPIGPVYKSKLPKEHFLRIVLANKFVASSDSNFIEQIMTVFRVFSVDENNIGDDR